MFKFNKSMGEISSINLEKLLKFVWPRFLESKSGLVFIINEWSRSPKEIEDSVKGLYAEGALFRFFDNTDYESFVNHHHVDRVLDVKPTKHLKKICRTIGEMWVIKLKNDFPEKHFRIYLYDTILRFHQIHEGEPPWLMEKDFQKDIKKSKLIIWEI